MIQKSSHTHIGVDGAGCKLVSFLRPTEAQRLGVGGCRQNVNIPCARLKAEQAVNASHIVNICFNLFTTFTSSCKGKWRGNLCLLMTCFRCAAIAAQMRRNVLHDAPQRARLVQLSAGLECA